MITQICLDIDGVLADWIGGASKLFGIDPEELYQRWPPGADITDVAGISMGEMWKAIDEAGIEFWATLEPYPWARDLWELCKVTAPSVILTSPSQHPTSLAGKLIWLDHMFGSPFRDYLMGPNKYFCARTGAVLIDDNDKKATRFVVDEEGIPTGASAILFPQPWNTLSKINGDKLEFVAQALGKLAE